MNREQQLFDALEGALTLIDMNKAPDWFVISVRAAMSSVHRESVAAVPGWKLVPLKSTREIEAAIKEVAPKWFAPSVYSAILGAAPPAPAREPLSGISRMGLACQAFGNPIPLEAYKLITAVEAAHGITPLSNTKE